MDGVDLDRLMRNVLQHRARRGQSQRELAAEIGLSASTICRVEQGQAPDLVGFSKLCRWLSTDPSVYLGTSTTAPTEPNYVRVRLDVVLEIPGEGVAPLEDVTLTIALTNGLREMGVDVRNAMCAKRKLTSCDARGARRNG